MVSAINCLPKPCEVSYDFLVQSTVSQIDSSGLEESNTLFTYLAGIDKTNPSHPHSIFHFHFIPKLKSPLGKSPNALAISEYD